MTGAGRGWPDGARSAVAVFLRHTGPPAFGLIEQPCLEPVDAVPVFADGHFVSLSVSYTFYRIPTDPTHPANRVPLTPEQELAIERAESSNLDAGLKAMILRMRFPIAWDAVRTTVITRADRTRPLADRLHSHIDDVRRTLPSSPIVEGGRVRLDPGADGEACIVAVGESGVRGVRIPNEPLVVAVGFEVERRAVTAVVPRAFLPTVRLDFTALPCQQDDD